MKDIFWNAIKGKKWTRYFVAALLIFALAMTGCSASQGTTDEKTGAASDGTTGEAVNEAVAGDIEDTDDLSEDGTFCEGEKAAGNENNETAEEDESAGPAEDGVYTSKDDVARYIHIYGHLPSNFITKKEADELGWSGGSLEPYAPGKCIGGNRFGNYEGLLPEKDGRVYTECDIDTLGADKRGAKRIVFSNDGLIYYTGDHYESFELLYGED